MTRAWAVVAGLVAAGGVAAAADPAPAEKTGIKVGERAPDFKLKDQTGAERELAALRKGGPVALVFYRSAAW
jgi:cytochrome oxidase Cu insertion factor (SCO1/SenC/PrrC family)